MKLEEMVQELRDREKIKELTYEYGLAIEAQDAERMAGLFTEDGSADFSSLGRGVIKGRDTLKEFYRSTWLLKVQPFFTNHVLHIQGDHATGTLLLGEPRDPRRPKPDRRRAATRRVREGEREMAIQVAAGGDVLFCATLRGLGQG